MKISTEVLSLEVTRKCNMRCRHCMRGDAQALEIPKEVIDRTLDQLSEIDTIVFTGGEPALNPEAMMYTLEACKKRKIPVYGFCIAANGKEVPDAFVDAVFSWYGYYMACNWHVGLPNDTGMISGEQLMKFVNCAAADQEENGSFVIALSADLYHEKIPYRNALRLMGLPGFSSSKAVDFKQYAVFNEGRAQTLKEQKKKEKLNHNFWIMETEEGFKADLLYVNAKGKIFGDCDLSYQHQEDKSVPQFSVFEDWAEKIVDETGKEFKKNTGIPA